MPLHSSGDSTMCSLPTAKVVDAIECCCDTRRRPLTIERHMGAAHQCGPYEVRLGGLDLADGGAEICDIEREKVDEETSPPFSVTYFFTHCEVIWP